MMTDDATGEEFPPLPVSCRADRMPDEATLLSMDWDTFGESWLRLGELLECGLIDGQEFHCRDRIFRAANIVRDAQEGVRRAKQQLAAVRSNLDALCEAQSGAALHGESEI